MDKDWKNYQYDEPCSYTCPRIDEIQEDINRVSGLCPVSRSGTVLSDPDDWTMGNLREFMEAYLEVNWEDIADSKLEDLRGDNSDLRDLGNDLVKCLEQAEEEFEVLEKDLKSAESKGAGLATECEELRAEIEELKRKLEDAEDNAAFYKRQSGAL